MRRNKIKKRKARKMFTKTARKVHKRNLPGRIMRGGTRL